MRGKNKLEKNSNLDIHQEGGFQTFSKILDSKILGEGSYQISPDNLNNPRITEEGVSKLP